MKKFWLILISLLLGVTIAMGVWHGITYKDKIKVFAEDTWAKIESTFKKNEEKEEHEHSFGEWRITTGPTCTEPGQETRKCECGFSEKRDIDALGHTCEVGICERCGTQLVHDVYCGMNKKISRSCQESKHITGVCSGCGEAYDVEIIPFSHEKFLNLYTEEEYISDDNVIRCPSKSYCEARVSSINSGNYLMSSWFYADYPDIMAVPANETDFSIFCRTCGVNITSTCFAAEKVVNPLSESWNA